MIIRGATPRDAAALSAFGRRVFEQTFAAENNPDDLRAYLDGAYHEERQREELTGGQVETLLVEDDETLIAFAQLRRGPGGNGVTGDRPIEIWRFYVDTPWHGRGVAAMLMAAAHASARAGNADSLWLAVWEHNRRAQAFYRKHGFAVVGEQIFQMGTDPQRDLVMAKRIAG